MTNGKVEGQISKEMTEKKYELEIEQWKHQKQWREQEIRLEKEKLKQARRDTWIRGFFSGLVGVIIAVTIPAWVAHYAEKAELQKTKRAQGQQKQETLIQLINSRESADSNLRAQMFNALLQNYFQDRDFRTKIAILEIIGLNFRDSLQTKPMFERLYQDIKENGKEETDELIDVLRKASQRIIKDQLQQIKYSKEGDVCEVEFKIDPISVTPQYPDCFQDLAIRLKEVKDEQIVVQTNSKNGSLLAKGDESFGDDFGVSFFDMPMIDYTSVASSGTFLKYSIVLRKIDRNKNLVNIAIANLPEDSFGTSDEYKFDEMLSEYLSN